MRQPRLRSLTRRGFTIIELLVVIAIITVLASMLLAGVQKARAAADRTVSANNLRQIGIALHLYHDSTGAFPAAQNGTGSASAFAVILPFVEQPGVFSKYDQTKGYSDATDADGDGYSNGGAQATPIGLSTLEFKLFVAPNMNKPLKRRVNGQAVTSYAMCGGSDVTFAAQSTPGFRSNGIINFGDRVRISQITDGSSNTIMAGEMHYGLKDYLYSGTGQADLDGFPREGNTTWALGYVSYSIGSTDIMFNTKSWAPSSDSGGLRGFRSDSVGGCMFIFGDASVHFLREGSMTADVYKALGTRAGGEIIDQRWLDQ